MADARRIALLAAGERGKEERVMTQDRRVTMNSIGSQGPGVDGNTRETTSPDVEGQARRALAVQILTTEHFTLQSARAAATAESSGRSTLLLTVLSATLVALALAAQVASPRDLLVLALLGLGLMFFLGLVTYLRVLDNGIEDYLYVKGINRIRHFYAEVAPETRAFFVLSQHDDPESIHRSMGMHQSKWQRLLTSASCVSLVNSLVAGVFVAAALQASGHPAFAITLATGAVSATLVLLAFLRHGKTRWRKAEEIAPARFPAMPADSQVRITGPRERGGEGFMAQQLSSLPEQAPIA